MLASNETKSSFLDKVDSGEPLNYSPTICTEEQVRTVMTGGDENDDLLTDFVSPNFEDICALKSVVLPLTQYEKDHIKASFLTINVELKRVLQN